MYIIKNNNRKRDTKIHVATTPPHRDDCKYMSLCSIAQTSRLLQSRREHKSEHTMG